MQALLSHISAVISGAAHRPLQLNKASAVGGGSINEAFRIESVDGMRYFLKLNDARHHSMFSAEATGLDTLAATGTLRVPRPIVHGIAGERCYLVLEYLDLKSQGSATQLGERLAALHRCTDKQFGFLHHNFIGTTMQPNDRVSDWTGFWRERRLDYQLQLAAKNRLGSALQSAGERLLDVLPVFFGNYQPQPSLLHGDLWSGNHAFLPDGSPVIFDPAAYFGDRECDIAMTELFGGYPDGFYAAYRAAWPLDAGYATRRDLYNLYHVLNHANLFGGGYKQQAQDMMQRLLAEVG